MFENIPYSKDRDEAYNTLLRQLELLIEDEKDVIANLANASALSTFRQKTPTSKNVKGAAQ